MGNGCCWSYFTVARPVLDMLGFGHREGFPGAASMHSLQGTRYMLVVSRLFPYLVTKKKSLLLSSSGEPVHLVLLGNHMHAMQRSLWWLRSHVSFIGKPRASCRSRSIMVHLGTIDVIMV
jgi:hypothetical protein